jgi:hypothetical protein
MVDVLSRFRVANGLEAALPALGEHHPDVRAAVEAMREAT